MQFNRINEIKLTLKNYFNELLDKKNIKKNNYGLLDDIKTAVEKAKFRKLNDTVILSYSQKDNNNSKHFNLGDFGLKCRKV